MYEFMLQLVSRNYPLLHLPPSLLRINLSKVRKFPYPDDNKIQQSIDGSPFEFRFAGVLHQFGILTGEYDDAVAPLRVPQNTPSQQYPIIIQNIPVNRPQ